VDVDLIGWVGVGLGGTYGCRCGILYVPMLGVVFYVGLVSHLAIYLQLCFLTEFISPYSLNAQRGWHTSELSHSYMIRHYCVILRKFIIYTWPSYTSISNLNVKLYYRQLHLKYLCNLARY